MSKRKSSGRESGARIPDVTAGSNALVQAQASGNVQRKLQEVQLARLAARLRELGSTRDTIRALGVDPEQYASELATRYADLSQKLRDPAPIQAKSLPPRVALLLNRFGDIFNPWQTVLAPNATDGLVQVPNSSNAGGTISAEIFQGDLAVGGEIWASGADEQWWVNTWQYVVPFPPTPSTFSQPGSLSYRFTVGGAIGFYRQDLVSGSVHLYATVFTTNDTANHPIQFTQPPVSSDFAINATLPAPGVPPILYAGTQINGTIALLPGATPAIGILIGLIFSVVNGIVQFFPGEFGEILLSNPDATMPSDIGRVEYRSDQPFWVNAVAQLVNLNSA
jgi:hypothetical protein